MAELILTWWPVIALVVSGLVAWIGWSSRQQFVTHDDFDRYIKTHEAEHKADAKVHDAVHEELDEALAEGAAKFREIEVKLGQLPTRRDHEALLRALGEVTGAIQGIGAKVDGLADRVAWVQSNLSTIVDHELAEGRQAKAIVSKVGP